MRGILTENTRCRVAVAGPATGSGDVSDSSISALSSGSAKISVPIGNMPPKVRKTSRAIARPSLTISQSIAAGSSPGMDELGRQVGQALHVPFGRADLQREVLFLHVAQLVQSLLQFLHGQGLRGEHQHP